MLFTFWKLERLPMKDICVELTDDCLKNLALIGKILGKSGVNIEGLCITSCKGRSAIHFMVEDDRTARSALEDAGIKIREVSEVLVLHKDEMHITGRPGSFGVICRTFADHGIKISFGYPAENNRFVFGIDNIAKARELLGSL
jgi:hypothetical protein